jgi:hypothetical protein
MPHYFEAFPTVRYDIEKNNRTELLTNLMVRFKITEILKRNKSIYFDYSIPENDRPDTVAYRVYGDATLDWLIFLINDIYDVHYDWPMSSASLNKYIKSIYGSVPEAMATVKEYRQILNEQTILFNGTIVPKRTLVVDLNTYNGLPVLEREAIDAYSYEIEKNEERRNITLISNKYLKGIIQSIEQVFEEND